MMRKAFCCLQLAALLVAGCSQPTGRGTATAGREFRDEVVVKTTPVKNQGRSPLCWAFAMLATIESEHLMKGDSVELSTDYYGRMLLRDEAREYFFSQKRGHISLRGMSSMLLNLLHTYGAEPYTSFYNERPVNYMVLAKRARQIADTAPSLAKMDERMEAMLDEGIGFMPRYVFMLGMEYTPRQFAESVCLPDEYLRLTSFTHHPFGKKFVLEVPDNQMRDSFLNIPIDTMMLHIEQALRHGHPVCWEGDISEPGFSFAESRAEVPQTRAAITQDLRQRAFERGKTTDDHCMELCGMARDRRGRLYFKAKNSWGRGNRYGGYMYLSYDYVRLKTIAVYMSRQFIMHNS